MNPVRTSVRRLATGVLAVALVVGAAVGPGPTAASAASAVPTGEMVNEVNKARKARGLAPYRTSADLTSVAMAQARRMASGSSLHHNPNLRTDVSGYRWVGENVGYGPTLAVIQKAFMESPSHRANVLDHKFTQVGIAAVRDGGRLWVAQVFRQPSAAPSKPAATRSADKTTERSKPKRAATKRTAAASSSSSNARAKARSGSTGSRERGSTTAGAPSTSTTPPQTTAPERSTRAAQPTSTTSRPAPGPSQTPSSAPTLTERVRSASESATPTADPVAHALAFAAAMHTVGG